MPGRESKLAVRLSVTLLVLFGPMLAVVGLVVLIPSIDAGIAKLLALFSGVWLMSSLLLSPVLLFPPSDHLPGPPGGDGGGGDDPPKPPNRRTRLAAACRCLTPSKRASASATTIAPIAVAVACGRAGPLGSRTVRRRRRPQAISAVTTVGGPSLRW